MSKKFVDVEEIIADKNANLLKRLPRFVLSYLKKILHQDEVNQIIYENTELKNEEFCKEIVNRFNLKLHVFGEGNIPQNGGVIFVVNHPLGGMDAMALVDIMSRYRKDIKFIVNDVLLTLENLKGLFVGVNKYGKNAKDSLRDLDQLFASDQAIFIFPAGLVSRQVDGEVRDLDWKKTFVTQAKKYNKTVVPVLLDGRLSPFFYRLAKWRIFFGIKANIEMLYLVNELFKQRGKEISVTFGKPILSDVFTQEKTDKQWAAWVREKVYKLKE